MVLDRPAARLFINQYARVLGAVHRLSGAALAPDPIALLCRARRSLEQDPELLNRAAEVLAEEKKVPPEILRAVQGIRLRYWVYLRDTSRYSIFIDPNQREGFAVIGITDRVRDLLGGSAVAFRTGHRGVSWPARQPCLDRRKLQTRIRCAVQGAEGGSSRQDVLRGIAVFAPPR